jgi:histidinol-phosphate aminotransferase
MKNYLSNFISSLTPYTAGEQPKDKKYVKLNTNENPYPPSPKAAAVLHTYSADTLGLYPDPEATKLREAIAEAEGVKKENVFCGNGSDEVLALCIPAFFDADGAGAAFADLTYSFYPVFCDFFSVPYERVPLKGDYSMDLDSLTKTRAQGILIANPNAPTGVGVPLSVMEKFVAENEDKIVIADEAYMGFYGQSAVPLTEKYKNLLVVKTFSKYYALAGLRCGYAIGDETLIKGLFAAKDCFNSYPVDSVCQAVCAAAVSDKEYYAATSAKVVEERTRVRDELIKMGFTVPESSANFLFAGRADKGGKYIYENLKARGVLVRFWNTDKLKDFCRITVGTREQNDKLLSALREIL